MIRPAIKQDFDTWLDLSREVEPLFGEMAENEDFKESIKKCISNLSAFCIIDNNGIEGIIAINRAENEISWLAVRERSRGKGYGHQLLKEALQCLDNEKPVFVQTFSTGENAGKAARELYMNFGFKDYKDGGKNPAGVDTIIMKLEKGSI